jgi:hypothetical protein
MPKFVVEREIPGIGTWRADRLQTAARGGFPCNRVSVVQGVIDPASAEARP